MYISVSLSVKVKGLMPTPSATVLRNELDHMKLVFARHCDSGSSYCGAVADGTKTPGSQGERREEGILRRSPSAPKDHGQYHK